MTSPRLSPSVPVRVAPATSNELVLHGLRSTFDPFSAFVDLLPPEAARGADVVVLDTTGLPADGVPAAAEAIQATGRPVLVLAEQGDERALLRFLRAGARGYVARPREARRLVEDVVAVANGELVIDPEVACKAAVLAARLLDLDQSPATLLGLSEREVQVLDRLQSGATAREIGAELYVSHETVRSHLKRIYRKLGVHDRTAALERAHEEGILTGRS